MVIYAVPERFRAGSAEIQRRLAGAPMSVIGHRRLILGLTEL